MAFAGKAALVVGVSMGKTVFMVGASITGKAVLMRKAAFMGKTVFESKTAFMSKAVFREKWHSWARQYSWVERYP